MNILTLFALPVLAITAAAIPAFTPVLAQQSAAQQSPAGPGDEKINQLIIYGNDKCPQSTEDEITVCARVDEKERYRIPKNLRATVQPVAESWSQRVKAYEYIAATGVGSCSASGAGGFTGCGLKSIDASYAEKAQDPGLAFGRLIAAERRKRLSGIDDEAQEVEGRVVEEERAAAIRKLQEQGNNVEAAGTTEADAQPLPEPK